ncbi:uncharacterized protein [Centruroides vittatus]|uniref:uncharacterized protein n=1 Tax=Centruroides vittatus TaxID=120091 RepID=UPI00350F7585
MAFHTGRRNEVHKQSYYVWFLGAKESRGLRGDEYIKPVLKSLLERERELEPVKVTLQVSNKGMKIIQNVTRKGSRTKTEQIKHFIPHHALTCVSQELKPNDDIVCCILLLFNPLTRCPVHVHAYRCDSVQTATTLRGQLQQLVDRPENQKKLREIECRLDAKGLLPQNVTRRCSSDGLSEDSCGSESPPVRKDRVSSLYDSLAAELRERLNNPNTCPILLPPRDYDTISRNQGRLSGIEDRKSTATNIIGKNSRFNVVSTEPGGESSCKSTSKSSGFGSDEALSSAIHESHPDSDSSSDDWTPPDEIYDWKRTPRPRIRSASPELSYYTSRHGSDPRYYVRRTPPEQRYLQEGQIRLHRRDSYDPYCDKKWKDFREPKKELVYRRLSNPVEGGRVRDQRPLSYPNVDDTFQSSNEYPNQESRERPRDRLSPKTRTNHNQDRLKRSEGLVRNPYHDLQAEGRSYRHSYAEAPGSRLVLNSHFYS